jgi:polyhydroxyalkanoate synthesis regulator phasin
MVMSMGYNELKSLVGCGKSWADQRAQFALDLADQHARGDISSDEYKELLEDLIRTDTLDRESDDMAIKMALVGAVKGIIAVL